MKTTFKDLPPRTSVWDKCLHRFFGMCPFIEERWTVADIVFGSKFSIWGWGAGGGEGGHAMQNAMVELVYRARSCGVIQDGHTFDLVPGTFLDPESTEAWVHKKIPRRKPRVHKQPGVKPWAVQTPSVFSPPK